MTARGAAGRVTAVHRQTRASLRWCLAFLIAAVAVAVLDGDAGRWAPLHLFLVGGLLTAVSTATQLLAVTWSAAPAPLDRLALAQRASLIAGASLLVLARRLEWPGWMAATAGALVVLALVLLAVSLGRIRSGAAVDRFLPAVDAYLIATTFGIAGSLLGAAVAAGVRSEHHDRLVTAHLGLNLYGLVGLVIAGTLPYMVATQARTTRGERATPGAVWAVVATMAAASAVMTVGALGGDERLRASGLAVYALAVVAVVRLLPRLGRRRFAWAGPRLVQLLCGVAWWAAMTGVLAWVTFDGGDPGPPRVALVVGGYAQILTASIAYLAPVVRGGGHAQLGRGLRRTRSWVGPLAGNAAGVAALVESRAALTVALAAWALDSTVRAAASLRPLGSAPVDAQVVQRHAGHEAEAGPAPERREQRHAERKGNLAGEEQQRPTQTEEEQQ